ncbi:nucleolar GTP-binding protein 1-like protein [Tanacetum coccineum]|uniref:Nucleolar GTP-binding protein 1-like protein n=1 Tax=Tanacetum coccineum TaxID=301880 RepID=A0ABQ5G6T6_9ASTR
MFGKRQTQLDSSNQQQQELAEIRKKKSVLIREYRIGKSTPRLFDKDRKFTSEKMGWQLSSLGLDPSKAIERARSKSRIRKSSMHLTIGGDEMDCDKNEGYKDSAMKVKAFKIGWDSCKKRNKEARKGEGDRVIPTLKPKHLYTGKRSNGKTQRR